MSTTETPLPTIGPDQRTPEWYAMRSEVFGASEAAALCGRSQYKQPLDLYVERKRGVKDDLSKVEAVNMGRWLEPGILAGYAETEGVAVTHPLPMLIHPTLPCLVASLDGRVCDGDDTPCVKLCQRKGRPVEAKWSMSPKVAAELGEERSDWVPDHWFFQVQQQMDVVGEEVADIAVVLFGRLKIYTVQRAQPIIDAIHSAAQEMVERLANDDPPPPHWTHPTAEKACKALWDCVSGKVVELPSDVAVHWETIRDLKAEAKRIEGRLCELQAKVLWALGDAEIGRLPWGDVEIKRISVGQSLITTADVDKARKDAEAMVSRIGEVKRKAYSYLRQRKAKT